MRIHHIAANGLDVQYVEAGDEAALHRRLPGSELLVVPDTGHDLPANRRACVTALLDFLVDARR